MAAAPRIARRLQTWLLTGPVGHFAAGALDFATALTRYALARRGARR
jgi:hypothetical protein